MKILHVMAGADAGGAETAFAELCVAQKLGGMDVYATCRPSRRNTALVEAGIPVLELPFGGLLDFKTGLALRRHMTSLRPDIVVTWMNRAAKKLPRHVRGVSYTWIARLGGYYNLKNYKDVDHFVVNAPDIGRWMQDQGTPQSTITFIPNFAEIDLNAAPINRAEVETPDDAFVFLTMSRLHENKGIDTLLTAFAKVPDSILWVAGDGPEAPALKKQADALGITDRIRFLGWRDDRWSLLAACDAFVFPSRHEPFGNSFMQAWAAGKALVTTASQGPSHYVEDGSDALVVPIDDTNALASAMEKVKNDPHLCQKLAAAGKTRYAQAFDKQAIIDQWQRLFDSLRQEA